MSRIPSLEAELIRAISEQQTAAQRRRTSLFVAGSIVLVAVVAATFLLTSRSTREQQSGADLPNGPEIAAVWQHAFAAFRRPSQPSDRLPASVVRMLSEARARSTAKTTTWGTALHDVQPQEARQVAQSFGARVWVIPGRSAACTVLISPSGARSLACTRAPSPSQAAAGKRLPRLIASGPAAWRPYNLISFVLLPDGATDVRTVRATQGVQSRPAPPQNGLLLRVGTATALEFTAPNGRTVVHRLQ